jgi:drug/metabolite transporter (DMT)-like permease
MARTATRTALFCTLALVGFAANSLLTRLALRPRLVDAATFTAVRIGTGAAALALLALARRPRAELAAGSWASAALLVAYALPFTYAYIRISAGVGALVLFGAVQLTMIGWGVLRGERPRPLEWLGLALAFAGLAALTLPGATRPDPLGVTLMVLAGIAWGAYSLRGRGARDPLGATAGNFLRGAPLALAPLALAALWPGRAGAPHATPAGLALAAASGALASGVGYTLWYAALPGLTALRAALVQLTVPVLAAAAAVVLLDEPATARLALAGAAVLGGLLVAILGRARR